MPGNGLCPASRSPRAFPRPPFVQTEVGTVYPARSADRYSEYHTDILSRHWGKSNAFAGKGRNREDFAAAKRLAAKSSLPWQRPSRRSSQATLAPGWHQHLRRGERAERIFSPISSTDNRSAGLAGSPPESGPSSESPTRPPASGRGADSESAGRGACCSSGESPHTRPGPSRCCG